MHPARESSPTSALEATDRPTVETTDELVMVMLHERVPLSLLVDLTDASAPVSAEILAAEGAPDTRWWEG